MESLDPPPSPSLRSVHLVPQSAAPPLDDLVQATISRSSRASGRSNLLAVKEGDETPLGSAFSDGERDEDGREQRPNSHSDASPEQQNISNIPRAHHASASEGECTSSSALCNRVDRRIDEREREREAD
jgi:hypothetical protein